MAEKGSFSQNNQDGDTQRKEFEPSTEYLEAIGSGKIKPTEKMVEYIKGWLQRRKERQRKNNRRNK